MSSRISVIVDLALALLLLAVAPALGITDPHQLALFALHERLDITSMTVSPTVLIANKRLRTGFDPDVAIDFTP